MIARKLALPRRRDALAPPYRTSSDGVPPPNRTRGRLGEEPAGLECFTARLVAGWSRVMVRASIVSISGLYAACATASPRSSRPPSVTVFAPGASLSLHENLNGVWRYGHTVAQTLAPSAQRTP